MFGVAKETVCITVNDVCQATVMVSGERIAEVVSGFENKYGFPQCIGAVNETHIPILAPKECAKDYYNREDYHSIIVQAVADHCYCFTDIYIGWPGSVHDSEVFKNSELHKCEGAKWNTSSQYT